MATPGGESEADLAARVAEWYRGAIAAVCPAARVEESLRRSPPEEAGLGILAAGKAAAEMARGAARALGDRALRGLVVTPEGAGGAPDGLGHIEASHPVPDARSERAANEALALARAMEEGERMIALISGGASALLCAPARGLSREDKIAATSAVMAAGAAIDDLNAVRKHLSAIKGGRLAAASAAPVTTLVASDVVGDPIAAVASGPTVPDPSTFADAWRAVEASCGAGALPAAAREHLLAGRRGERDETPVAPRPGDRAEVIAGIGACVEEAASAARADGARAEEHSRAIVGDVVDVAEDIARVAELTIDRAEASGEVNAAVAGGEPTVALPPEPGAGGRAHQLALLLAERLVGRARIAVLVAGTDGIDGNSRGAGAVVTGATWEAIRAAGLDPRAALARRDAATALAAAGAQIVTGPTGRNHADLILIAARP